VIVIDSSAFSKLLIKEENWENVARYLKPGQTICAVDILIIETANVIWKYLTLHRKITEDQALELYGKMIELTNKEVIITEKGEKFLRRALETSIQYKIPVHDSPFLAFSESLSATLITSDQKQNTAARNMGLVSIYIE